MRGVGPTSACQAYWACRWPWSLIHKHLAKVQWHGPLRGQWYGCQCRSRYVSHSGLADLAMFAWLLTHTNLSLYQFAAAATGALAIGRRRQARRPISAPYWPLTSLWSRLPPSPSSASVLYLLIRGICSLISGSYVSTSVLHNNISVVSLFELGS